MPVSQGFKRCPLLVNQLSADVLFHIRVGVCFQLVHSTRWTLLRLNKADWLWPDLRNWRLVWTDVSRKEVSFELCI